MVVLLALLVVAVPGCKHDPIEPVVVEDFVWVDDSAWATPINTVPCVPNIVYFQNTVYPILITYCTTAGCHDGISLDNSDSEPDTIFSLTTYAKIMNKVEPGSLSDSELWDGGITSTDHPMPPDTMPQLTLAQEQAIQNWILQFAPNNACNSCDTTAAISYAADIKPIFQNKCNGCHGGTQGGLPAAQLNLTVDATCQGIALDSRLERSIKHAPNISAMPYYPVPNNERPFLPACDIYKLMKWQRTGASITN